MWNFDEKAFDEFIMKKFNLKTGEPSNEPETETNPEENVENLNEAALSEAITESLNEDIIDKYQDIETYSYDYQMISSINISPNKQSMFSKTPKAKSKSENETKDLTRFSTKSTNWTAAAAPKENSSPNSLSGMNGSSIVENSTSMSTRISTRSTTTTSPSSNTRSGDDRFGNKNMAKNIVIGSSSTSKTTTLAPASQTPSPNVSTPGSNSARHAGAMTSGITLGSSGRQAQAAATLHTLTGGSKQSVPWNKPIGIASGANQNSMAMAKPPNNAEQRMSPSTVQQQTRQTSLTNFGDKSNPTQNSMSMAKQTSVITSTRSTPQALSSGSAMVVGAQLAKVGPKQTIDLTKNGAKSTNNANPEVIDLEEGAEDKKSESVIGGGEDTVRCKICQMVLKNQRELLVNHCKIYHASQIAASRMSKRPSDPSNNEGPSQPSPTPIQSAAWGQGVGGQGRSGAQAPGGGLGQLGGLAQGGGQAQVGQAQAQAQTQPWMQPRAGLRSSVLGQGAQQSHQVQSAQVGMRGPVSGAQGQTQSRGISSSMQGGLSSQLGGLRNSMPSSHPGGYQRSPGGIPGPPPPKRINTGMTYIRA